jgi:hypothetical protein
MRKEGFSQPDVMLEMIPVIEKYFEFGSNRIGPHILGIERSDLTEAAVSTIFEMSAHTVLPC